ncbi:MAG TPA: hypothetical protein VG897_13600, partial [Terriglobales bacterium]|nr:hypothetical protein [Terriglobales bacterium]
NLRLRKVSGDAQVINVGDVFAPIALQVTDDLGNAIAGVTVSFEVHVYRAEDSDTQATTGEVVTAHGEDPVVIWSEFVTVTTDVAGLAVLPAIPMPNQPVVARIRATAGALRADLELKSVAMNIGSNHEAGSGASALRNELKLRRRQSISTKRLLKKSGRPWPPASHKETSRYFFR